MVITGRGGIGKSSCVIEYGKRYKNDNRIVRHINADEVNKIDQAYQELVKELNINVTGHSSSMVIKLIHNRIMELPQEILFIFDNVQQYDDIKNYIGNLPPNVKILITTRRPKLITDVPNIALEEFDDDAAMRYLEYSLKNRLSGEKTIREVVSNASTLPYDLKCIAAYLIDNPFIDSKTAITKTGGKIKGKLFEEFAISNDEVKQQAWQILQYAAYLDPDFISIEIIKELFSEQVREVEEAIKKLESLSLISVMTNATGQIGFRIHRKLQKSVLYTVQNHPKYSIDNEEVMNHLLSMLDNLFPEVTEDPGIKWQIASNLQPHIKKILDLKFKVITRKAKINQANIYYKLAQVYQTVNINYKQALEYAKTALDQRRSLHNNKHQDVANSLNVVGWIYRQSGNGIEGLKYLRKGLQMRWQIYQDDHPYIVESLCNIGWTCQELGEIQEGLKYSKMALKMSRRLYSRNHYNIARSLTIVATGYLNLGKFEKSLEYFQEAFQMLKTLYSGNNLRVIMALNGLAYNYHKLGNYAEALNYAKTAMSMSTELYPDGYSYTVYILRSYGAALIELGKLEEGLIALHKALEVSTKFSMSKRFITAFVNYNLGIAYFKSGDYQKALNYAKESLSLRQEKYTNVKNHPEIVESLHSLGDIYLALNDKVKALEFYNKALTMSKTLSLDHLSETKELEQKVKGLE